MGTTVRISGPGAADPRGLRTDQRRRWRAGDPVPVEAYLADHPSLHADSEVVLDLIYNEVVLRAERGERPVPAEYERRFPALAEPIRLQFEVFDALSAGTLAGPAAGGAPADFPRPPGYDVLGELGRGGMGVVYRAVHRALNRPVALKVVRAGDLAGPDDLARFRRESEATARLQHPNVVQVFEVGEVAGRPFLALEYLDGGTLSDRLAGRPLEARAAADLVRTLAAAVEHAHAKGVVHRDLKPQNVLLAADGTPKIADFGLAKLPRGDDTTQSGALVGSPSYMAPEQAGGPGRVGPVADVYALGAILYEVLTGRPPFVGPTPLDTLEQVRNAEPVAPRRLQPKCPRDLETVCLKCLEKRPDRRYPSAAALADDLTRFLDGRAVAARPVGAGGRAIRWARRKPTAAALAVVSAGSLTLMVSGLTIGLLVVEDRRRVAEGALIAANAANQEKGLALEAAAQAGREKDDALAGERTARVAERQGDYCTRVAFALRAWSGNEVPQADALLDGCPTECRNWEWGYLKRLCRSGLTTLDPGGDGGEILYSVAVSPDGRLIAAGAFRGTVSVWEAATGRKVATLAAYASVLAFSPDGRLLVTGRAVLMPAREARATGPIGDTLQVWDVDTGKVVHSWAPDPRGVTRVTFSPDGKWLAATGYDGAVRVWDAATGGPQAVLPGTTAEASRVVFSPDGGLLAAGYNDGKVRVWAAGTWVARYVLTGRPVIVGLGFAATGRLIAGTSAGDIYVWDMADGHALGTFHGRAVWAGDMAVRADGVEVAMTDRDGSVRIIDGRTGLELRAYHVPSGAARAIAYTPDGRRLAVATGVPGPLAVWDVTQAQEVRTRMLPNRSGADLCYSPDGRFLAFNASSTIALWDAESLTPLRVLSGAPTHAHLCFRADGSRLAAANGSALAVWDTDTGERLTSAGGLAVPDPPAGDQPAVLKIPRPEVLTIASSPDGRQVAVAGRAGMVSVWAADGTGLVQICSLGGTTRTAIAQYSPDGRFLVAISEYGVAFVWDAADGRLVRTLGDAHSENRGLAFSRDGRYFAAGNGTKSISVWETATGREVRRLPRSGRLYALAFSPDGRRLAAATAGRDPAQAELWLWDPESGQEILNLHVPIRVVIGLCFHPNGKQLVAHAADRVLVWDATPLPGP